MFDNAPKLPPDMRVRRYTCNDVPLKVFDPSTAIRGACGNCGLERIEYVNNLVRAARLGNVSINDLSNLLACQRKGCDGRIQFEVD